MRGDPEIVGDAVRAVAGLLRETIAPESPCFEPAVYARNLGGDLVEVSFPLSRRAVDRIAAYLEAIERIAQCIDDIDRAGSPS